jgi:hypothetical protein
MSKTLIPTNTDFPSLFHIANGNSSLSMPFTREIFLLDCYIAGTNFRPDIVEIEPNLTVGTQLKLQREPNNEFDESAIAIYTSQEYHLGYVPKIKNEVPARLLDAGKSLSAKLVAKQWNDSWLKLDIEIFLND